MKPADSLNPACSLLLVEEGVGPQVSFILVPFFDEVGEEHGLVFPGLGFFLALLVFEFLNLAAEGEPALVDASVGSGVEVPEVHDLAFAVGDAFFDFGEVPSFEVFSFGELAGEQVESKAVLVKLVVEEGVHVLAAG